MKPAVTRGRHGIQIAGRLPGVLPLFRASLTLDALGGVFVAVTGGVAVEAGVYGISYTRSHGLDARPVQVVFPLFVVAMLLVPAVASVGSFLVFGVDGPCSRCCWWWPSTGGARRWCRRVADAGMR